MTNFYLAFDLGASSGRTILGEIYDNKISISEVSRFVNSYIKINGHYYWNIYNIFEELQKGLRSATSKLSEQKAPHLKIESIGIDSWGVDFGLLDKDGNIINLPLSYRDLITDGIIENFSTNVLDAFQLYQITGIQMLKFNSVFQLYALKKNNMDVLKNANTMLFIPDLLNYMFTGVKTTEYTIASTSQMLDGKSKTWSNDLLETTGISKEIVTDIIQPGKTIGFINSDIASSLDIAQIPVVSVASHDTASAVISVPAKNDNWAFLSSGTWSIMGIEIKEPIISVKSFNYGFGNEGGIEGTTRFLKNICGMWLLEQCKRIWDTDKTITYSELIKMSEDATPFSLFIDPDDPCFANPVNMHEAIKEYCIKTKQNPPSTIGQIVRIIFESLALKYRYTMDLLKELSPKPIETLHIIGGGCQNELLCQYTANALNMTVIAGPAEATAIGNIMVQALAQKRVSSLKKIRQIVINSVDLKTYTPKTTESWNKAYNQFIEIIHLKQNILL